MKKTPTVFERDWDGDRSRVLNQPHKDCGWVFAGEGTATRKLDGTCCMVRDGKLFKRYDAKKGRVVPIGFEPTQDPDPITGHLPGWLPVGDDPSDCWHREAWNKFAPLANGTYELLGPKVQGNPEKMESHCLALHGADEIQAPRDFDSLRGFFDGSIEGIVWWHPDGRMVKIKAKDFGVRRKL